MSNPTGWGATLLCEMTLKSGLLLLVGGGLALLARKRSAATRHLIWAMLLCGLLILPLFCLLLPHWNLAILPRQEPGFPTVSRSPTSAVRDRVEPASLLTAGNRLPASAPAAAVASTSPAPPASRLTLPSMPSPSEKRASVSHALQAPASRAFSAAAVGTILMWLWGVGVLVTLIPLGVGLHCRVQLGRQSRSLMDGPQREMLKETATALSLPRPVTLLLGPPEQRLSMPMAWGILDSTVWLPSGSAHWPEEQLRIVLLHELAHIKRQDPLLHLLAQGVCALYWFHPAVWWVAGRLNLESERACDDCVLSAGITPTTYAATLLEVIRTMRTQRHVTLGAVSMASSSRLENRLHSILDAGRTRHTLSHRRVWMAAGAVLTLLVPLASLRVGARPLPKAMPARSVAFAGPQQQNAGQEAEAQEQQEISRQEATPKTQKEQKERLLEQQQALAERQKSLDALQARKAARHKSLELQKLALEAQEQDLEQARAQRSDKAARLQSLAAQKRALQEAEQRILIEKDKALKRAEEAQQKAARSHKIQDDYYGTDRSLQEENARLKRRVEELERRLKRQEENGSQPQELESITLREEMQQSEALLQQKMEKLRVLRLKVEAGALSLQDLKQAEAETAHAEAELASKRELLQKTKQRSALQADYRKTLLRNQLTHINIELKLVEETLQAKMAQFKAGVIDQTAVNQERARLEQLTIRRSALTQQLAVLEKQNKKP